MLLENAGVTLTGVMGRERCWMKILHWGTAGATPRAPCGLLQNEGANFRIKTNWGKHGVDMQTATFGSAPHQRAPQAEMDRADKPAQARQLVLHLSRTGRALNFPFPALPFCPTHVPTAGLLLSSSTFYCMFTVEPTPERHCTVPNTVTLLPRQPTQRPNTKPSTDINGSVS